MFYNEHSHFIEMHAQHQKKTYEHKDKSGKYTVEDGIITPKDLWNIWLKFFAIEILWIFGIFP